MGQPYLKIWPNQDNIFLIFSFKHANLVQMTPLLLLNSEQSQIRSYESSKSSHGRNPQDGGLRDFDGERMNRKKTKIYKTKAIREFVPYHYGGLRIVLNVVVTIQVLAALPDLMDFYFFSRFFVRSRTLIKFKDFEEISNFFLKIIKYFVTCLSARVFIL